MKPVAIVVLLMLLLWQRGAAQQPPAISAVPELDQILARLTPIIAQSVARRDSGHPVFHGCYDWHSAVHGHWALLRIARVAPRYQDQALSVEQSLSVDGLAREAAFLRENPQFELPYGRAWFLRLAIEFELWAGQSKRADPQRLRGMAGEVARSLLAHYTAAAPSPQSGEYANDSWALVQLYAYARHTHDGKLQQSTQSLIDNRMLRPTVAPSLRDDFASGEFFSRFGNWAYLIAHTQSAEVTAAFLQQHPLADEELRPVPLAPGAHSLGLNWSRAWALRALSRVTPDAATRTRLDRAFLDHVQTALRQHAVYAGDFMSYDHWVPQFAVYALTE